MDNGKSDEDQTQPGETGSSESDGDAGNDLPVGTVPSWGHRGPDDIPAKGDHDEEADEEGTRPGSAPSGSE